MAKFHPWSPRAASLVAALIVFTAATAAQARLLQGPLLRPAPQAQPEELVAPATVATPAITGPMIPGAPIVAMPTATTALDPSCCPQPCCPTPCITYRHLGRPLRCCGCEPPVQTVLCVNNPCTCCPVNVPVCLPACCTGAPSVNCRHGLFAGDGVITYDWCCGVSVVIKFKRCGDVIVTYHHA